MSYADQSSSALRHGVVVALRRGDGRWLLVKRAATLVRAPGKVGFPGGQVEAGETQQEAVVREMREELSIAVCPICKFWEADDQVPGFVLHGWLAEWINPSEQIIPDPREVAEVFWLRADEVLKCAEGFSGNGAYIAALLEVAPESDCG